MAVGPVRVRNDSYHGRSRRPAGITVTDGRRPHDCDVAMKDALRV
jgi:hypothetical protein